MERWYRATGVATRTLVRALDVRLHVSGLEHVPTTGPVVLASTHSSYPDFLWIGLAAHERGRWVRFMTRHDVWHSRAARAMDGMGHIPVDREVPAAAYLAARRLLRQGEAVGMFPEAGISFSYAVRSLMPQRWLEKPVLRWSRLRCGDRRSSGPSTPADPIASFAPTRDGTNVWT